MEPGGNLIGAHHVAVDHGDVLLAVAIVPEGHDVEPAKSARQLGDGLDPDADVVGAEALAVVGPVALDQLLAGVDAREVAEGLSHGSTITRRGRRAGAAVWAITPKVY